MLTLALLLVLLLFLVGLIIVGGLAYAVYRWPVVTMPLTVALAGAAVLAAVVTEVASVGVR
ncbi:hypothetical protein ABZY05_47650 [Streptomyces canus]|uniref:hypothetical protein n=1 Tax=Streptomyces canus TaxID=58343 RepID=UPI0033AA608D